MVIVKIELENVIYNVSCKKVFAIHQKKQPLGGRPRKPFPNTLTPFNHFLGEKILKNPEKALQETKIVSKI